MCCYSDAKGGENGTMKLQNQAKLAAGAHRGHMAKHGRAPAEGAQYTTNFCKSQYPTNFQKKFNTQLIFGNLNTQLTLNKLNTQLIFQKNSTQLILEKLNTSEQVSTLICDGYAS